MPNLKKYKKKRDETKSPEPKGVKKSSKSKLPIFVVQRHDASRLHFDLRIEYKGVLLSWAVPKGPSVDPKEKRLAVHVEDHPLDYANFEGRIPKGEYGAGKVEIWDKGALTHERSETRRGITTKITKGLKKGHIKLIFHGKKMKGEYSLVKIKKEKKNWLLVKSDDKYANKPFKPEVNKLDKSKVKREEKFNELIEEFVKRKEIKKWKNKNKISPMLAKLSDKAFDNKNWIFEIKHDGYRILADINQGKVTLTSRNGKDYSKKFSQITSELSGFGINAIVDGEVVVVDQNGISNFGYFKDFEKDKSKTLVYFIFDILKLNGYDLTQLKLTDRKEILEKILYKNHHIIYSDHISKSGKDVYKASEELNLEGIIAKEKNSKYEIGKRSQHWLKIKNKRTQDCVIVGYLTNTSGKLKSLSLAIQEDDQIKYIGNVGSGIPEKDGKELLKSLKKLKIKTPKAKNASAADEDTQWVKPNLVCEIEYLEITPNMMLRHPVFLRMREKDIHETVLEKPDNKPRRILTIAKDDERILHFDGNEVKLTNLDKVYWPREKYTKEDLINYYIKIADFILPYLKKRPLSLHRHPDGINGEDFYQKDIRHEPDWIETVDVYSQSANRNIHYLICNDKASLVYLANLGSIEIHPWLSTTKNLDQPNVGVIDLDPHGVEFDDVIETARVAHDVLEFLKIPNFIKTSGLFGLHIYIPIQPKYSYEQIRNFILLICQLINKELPGLTSLERKPEKRKNRIYLDYLQNRKAQTIAAPYSLRPIDGARVSTPLHWSEVNQNLNPANYTIKTIFGRLNRVDDIWRQMDNQSIRIEEYLKRIEKEL